MSTAQGAEGTPKEKGRGRLGSFLLKDHRYVLLGTSVVAVLGMWLSMQPRSSLSFLAPVYALEVVMYYVLLAWVIVSAVALVTKLAKWRDYAQTSPFAKPAARRAERRCSYVVWLFSAVLFVDRAVMGFVSVVQGAVASNSNPKDFLSAMVYMVYKGRGIFARGIATTIELAVFGTVIAFFLALLLVFLRLQRIDRPDNDFVRFLKVVGCGFAKVYSAVVRGTPMMVQSLIIYFAGFAVLSGSGMSTNEIRAVWSTFVAGLVTISLNSTAYMMEVLRGGIEAVDPGQREAAEAMGMRGALIMRRVILPQAFRIALPPYGNTLVMMLKDSSLVSTITVAEMTRAGQLIASSTFQNMTVYTLVALLYLVMSLPLVYGLRRLEHRMGAGRAKR